jgi:hypothetical protein
MQSNLHDPLAKETAWTEASTRFQGLSVKGFNRAWTRAIEETGASDWKKPGRRKRK